MTPIDIRNIGIYESRRAVAFMRHMQAHIDDGDEGNMAHMIPDGEVGCTICGKAATDVYLEAKE